jgi:glyoxylase-like metal-dependent hydrolase (beta-lactamase superfamily II)
MKKIVKNIFIEKGYPGVTLGAITTSQGIIYIDAPPQPEDTQSWRVAVRNRSSGSDHVLIYMDDHPDRSLGGRAMNCPIIAHEKTAKVFASRSAVFKSQLPESGSVWETCQGLSGIRWLSPNITFTERTSLFWGELQVILEHHPGPTQGSIWLIIPKKKIVFVGDTLSINQPPFLANSDIDAWVASLDELMSAKYAEHIIVSSRGGLVPNESIRDQRRYLKDVQKRLGRLASRNATPDAIERHLPGLLSKFSYPSTRHEMYTQRLRYGLTKLYAEFS